MPNPVKTLGYIKCHSSSSPRLVKSPSNSIRYKLLEDLQLIKKIYNHTENQKKKTFLLVINNAIIYKFFKDLTNHSKKTN